MGQSLLREIKSPQDLKQLTLDELEALAGGKFAARSSAQWSAREAIWGGPIWALLSLPWPCIPLYLVPAIELFGTWATNAILTNWLQAGVKDFTRSANGRVFPGFPLPKESEHDHFGVGHSSTSISAAAGMAIARDLRGEDYHVVAVMGDGALTGGHGLRGFKPHGLVGHRFGCYPQ